MPAGSTTGQITALIAEIAENRRQEIRRAVALAQRDPRKAAYHTGLADGMNNMIAKLRTILNSASMMKGDKASD